jgi:FxsC-like protein
MTTLVEKQDDHAPYFFMSYAPAPRLPGEDPVALATEFFDDLSEQVRTVRGASSRRQAGHFGPELAPGERWSDRVGQELAACRVFVPMYSPHYFASELCGRELSAFLQRARQAVSALPPIVPVLWAPTPVSWPRVPAPSVSFGDSDVDARYSEGGLYGLMALRDATDRDYGTVLRVLGARIVQLAEQSPIPSGLTVDLGTAPNAFEPPTRSPLGLHVLAPTLSRLPKGRDDAQYGTTSLEWNPYRHETSKDLAQHMVDIARNLGYQPRPSTFDDGLHDLSRSEPGDGPAVLVVDPWALEDRDWRAQLAELDKRDIPWVGVVVAWNLRDPQTNRDQQRLLEQVHATLDHRFARRRIALRLDAGVAATIADFGRALSAIVQEAATQYLRRSPVSSHRTEGRGARHPGGT